MRRKMLDYAEMIQILSHNLENSQDLKAEEGTESCVGPYVCKIREVR
jgi:hypothetical protein